MKKIIGLLLAVGITLGLSAQKKTLKGNFNSTPGGKTKVIVVRPYTPFYSPFYYGYRSWGYPYGYGYYPYAGFGPSENRPTELDLEIEKLKNDYAHQIATVRHDKSIKKSERKQRIRDLKHERENAIIDLKKDYYKEKNENS